MKLPVERGLLPIILCLLKLPEILLQLYRIRPGTLFRRKKCGLHFKRRPQLLHLCHRAPVHPEQKRERRNQAVIEIFGDIICPSLNRMDDPEQPERMQGFPHHRSGHPHLFRHHPFRRKCVPLPQQSILDILYDYYEEQGFFDEDSDDEVDIDEDEILQYVVDQVEKDKKAGEKLAQKFDEDRIADVLEGEYGYCDKTGVFTDNEDEE